LSVRLVFVGTLIADFRHLKLDVVNCAFWVDVVNGALVS